jgi:MscS family membrane protein
MKLDRKMPVALLLIVAAFGPLPAKAQDVVTESGTVTVTTTPTPPPGPQDALNRGTPRGSIVGFLEACSAFDFEKAAEFLDLRNLPEEARELGGKELARQLNHVLSRSVWLDDYNVSDDPEGNKGDGLPDYRDELVVIRRLHGAQEPLWMQHIPRGDGEQIWKVSNRSVALIPELYEEFSYPQIIERVRGWFPQEAAFLGLETFKWFILIIVALLSWPAFYLLGRLLSALFRNRDNEMYSIIRQALTGPFVALGVLLLTGAFLDELGAGAYAQQIMKSRTLSTLVVVWALWSIINLYKKQKQDKLDRLGRPGAAKLIRPMAAFLKIVILVFASLFWLNNIGVNITTVLAGLGVGGLAIALALQKPIEDMMGAFTIFSQATLRVGDFCRYGEITGIVEDIGLRTTRLRTLTNTLVSIPNSRIAYMEVENFTAREKIRFWPTLRLRYDTTPEQLHTVMDNILQLLEQHERVHDEPLRVRLTDFDEDAILVKVHSFLKTIDFPEALEIGEDLNFRILEIIHAAGARFALPGKSIYLEGEESSTFIPDVQKPA